MARTIRSAASIRGLIDDHIAFTLAREGVIRPASVPLGPLVDSAAWASEQDGLTLDVQAPHAVFADPSLTRQLVMNLILNAVERAQEGQRAALRVVSSPADEDGWIRVCFADRDVEPRLAIRRAGGDPVGGVPVGALSVGAAPPTSSGPLPDSPRLALCHTIVARHGGVISQAPNAAGGSTITFTLPAA